MKILILTNHSFMLYRFRFELIRKLMEMHEVVLSMPFVGHEDDFKALGIRCIETDVDRRGINPAKEGKLFSAYRKLLKEEKPDLVITYSIKPNIYGGIACRLAKIPYCANVQGLGSAFQTKFLSSVATMLYKYAFAKVKTVFFENEGNAAVFREKRIIPAEKQTLLRGAGVNLEKYPLTPYPSDDVLHFLYLGRIMREKGIDELFTAVRLLHARYGSRVVLDLVGFFEDEYKEQVEALEAEGIVRFHGFQSNPVPFYANADCVVLPSYHEGMSNVLLEAAAIGRPVITSDIPGCREAVEEGKSGYLCAVRDADSLYLQMERMMQLTRTEREAMGLAARAKMEREFDKEKVVAATVDALLGNGGHAR